jgi:hypothetical protein
MFLKLRVGFSFEMSDDVGSDICVRNSLTVIRFRDVAAAGGAAHCARRNTAKVSAAPS